MKLKVPFAVSVVQGASTGLNKLTICVKGTPFLFDIADDGVSSTCLSISLLAAVAIETTAFSTLP